MYIYLYIFPLLQESFFLIFPIFLYRKRHWKNKQATLFRGLKSVMLNWNEYILYKSVFCCASFLFCKWLNEKKKLNQIKYGHI